MTLLNVFNAFFLIFFIVQLGIVKPNEPQPPVLHLIYWYTYYKTVLKELDNNSIFFAF